VAGGAPHAASADTIVAPEGREIPGAASLDLLGTHVGITESAAAEAAVRAVLSGARPSQDRLVAPVLSVILPAFMPPHAEA
jgi:hypothetical protein